MEGIIIGIDPEQMQDPYDPQHPQGNEPRQEEKGQDRTQIYDSVKGDQKP